MNPSPHPSTLVGHYLVSPLTRDLDGGLFACSVSIRSGSGSGTTDRVLRLSRQFRSRRAAADYARDQGLSWLARERPQTLPA